MAENDDRPELYSESDAYRSCDATAANGDGEPMADLKDTKDGGVTSLFVPPRDHYGDGEDSTVAMPDLPGGANAVHVEDDVNNIDNVEDDAASSPDRDNKDDTIQKEIETIQHSQDDLNPQNLVDLQQYPVGVDVGEVPLDGMCAWFDHPHNISGDGEIDQMLNSDQIENSENSQQFSDSTGHVVNTQSNDPENLNKTFSTLDSVSLDGSYHSAESQATNNTLVGAQNSGEVTEPENINLVKHLEEQRITSVEHLVEDQDGDTGLVEPAHIQSTVFTPPSDYQPELTDDQAQSSNKLVKGNNQEEKESCQSSKLIDQRHPHSPTQQKAPGKDHAFINHSQAHGTPAHTQKHAPKHTHDGPNHAHDGPNHAHDGPKHAHDGSKHAHDGPKHAHDGPNHTHDGPKHAHDGPKQAHNESEHAHNGLLKHTHDVPKHSHGAFVHNPPHHHPHKCSNVLEAASHAQHGTERVYMYVPDRGEAVAGTNFPAQPVPAPSESTSTQTVNSFIDSLDGHVPETEQQQQDTVADDGICQSKPQTLQNQTRHPEYPVNYNNYKVCRQVQPGVKECLILETGEHVTCGKPVESTTQDQKENDGDPKTPVISDGSSVDKESDSTSSGTVKRAGFKIVNKTKDINEPLDTESCPEPNLYAEKDQSENAFTNNRQPLDGQYRSMNHRNHLPSERALVDPITGIDHNDVYVYETESDLRNFSGGYDDGQNGWAERVNNGYMPRDRVESSNSDVLRTAVLRSQSLDSEDVDMSALKRAERWLDGRETPVSPRRQNVSNSFSSTASGPIPGFRTLQEQQASWMKMFKLLEEQHQSDLVTQYKQHQRNIHNLQEQIEEDLCRQQNSFQQKLDVHRELMLHNTSYAGSYMPGDLNGEGEVTGQISQQAPSGLPRPFLPEETDGDEVPVSESPVALESEEEEGLTGQFIAGRYHGTPAQIMSESAKKRMQNIKPESPENVDYETSYRYKATEQIPLTDIEYLDSEDGEPSLSNYLSQSKISSQRQTREGDYSTSANVSLREKHSKHLADLRTYYEQELSDLKAALTSPDYIKSQSPYKRVMEENLQLQGRIETQDDDLQALKRQNRELDNKSQTLQIRLDDTLEMYEESQAAISTLRHHVEDLRLLVKEGEVRLKDMELENNRLTAALNDAHKTNEQQAVESKKTENTLKRLTERHENLHRENESNKEALNQMDSKLYDSRMEIVQLKRLVSKLELETNRLSRENNILRHKGLVSSLGLSNFYPSELTPSRQVTPKHLTSHSVPESLASPELSDVLPEEHLDSDYSADNNSTPPKDETRCFTDDSYRSPIMKAEDDLRMLRRTVKENLGQSLVSQKTIPRSSSTPAKMNKLDMPRKGQSSRSPKSSSRRSDADRNSSINRSTKTPDSVTIIDSLMSRKNPPVEISDHFPSNGTPTRFDIKAGSSAVRRNLASSKISPSSKKGRIEKDGTLERAVQNTLDKVKAGEFATRPNWENRDTTTVKTAKSQLRPKVREEKLQERVRTIHDLEVKYDNLQAEKRELESALSKVPLSGKHHHHFQKEKDDLDNRLDFVEKELGSVRMSLKRYNVLKTSGH